MQLLSRIQTGYMKRRENLLDCISQFVRTSVLSIGVLCAWGDFVNLSIWETIFFLVILMFLLIVGLAIHHYSSVLACKLPWIYALFGITVAIAGNMRRLFYGVIAVINIGIAYWNIKEDDAFPYIINGNQSQDGLYVLGLVLVFLIASICWYLAWKGAITLGFIMSTLVLLPGIVLKTCSFLGTVFLTLGLMGLWLYYVKAGSSRMRFMWTILGGFLFVNMAAIAENKYSDSLEQFKNKTLLLIEKARFGEDTLPQGDLTKAYIMKKDDTIRLKVTSADEKALYLRGYTAGQYEDGQWKPLKRSAYSGKRTGFLKWLKNHDFDPNSEYALTRKLNSTHENVTSDANVIKIQNLAANRKYVYTTYSASEPDGSYGINSLRDEGYRSYAISGAEKYEIYDYSDDIPGELNKLEDWMYSPDTESESNYLKEESIYRNFVYDSYLDIGDELLPLIRKVFHSSYDIADKNTDSQENSIYTVTQNVREVLRKNMVYSPKPAEPENTEDPLIAFLQGKRAGNAAFFASAGVLAFRSYGIPARYVEGYLKARTEDTDSTQTINLRSKDCHAWVEIYMDGLGWTPVDVTPGYYYDNYTLLQMSSLPDNIEKASVTKSHNSDTDNSLGLKEEDETIQEKSAEGIALSMAISGGILLLAFILLMIVTGAGFKSLYDDWRIERLLFLAEKEDTVDAFARGIEKQLKRLGIEMHVGWLCDETEKRIVSYIPEVSEGEYSRVNELLEKWIYGDKELELYEIRVLYSFLKKLKINVDRLYRNKFIPNLKYIRGK